MKYINRAQAKKQTGLSYIGSINSSAKILKNKKVSNNYTYIIYLAPANVSGYNVCQHSTPECRLGCLATSGRAKMDIDSKQFKIQNARINKTKLFYEHTEFFMRWVIDEIKSFREKAIKDNYDFSIRLNGTSDIDWSEIKIMNENIFDIFPDVQFYDYTKDITKILKPQPKNYHLTFSYSGRNESIAKKVLSNNNNVAVIFNLKKGDVLPETWNGFPVIDGDITDYRPNDGNGVVVGLRWKNIADKKANDKIKNSCFVVQTEKLIPATT